MYSFKRSVAQRLKFVSIIDFTRYPSDIIISKFYLLTKEFLIEGVLVMCYHISKIVQIQKEVGMMEELINRSNAIPVILKLEKLYPLLFHN
jgi:hypothetical protein